MELAVLRPADMFLRTLIPEGFFLQVVLDLPPHHAAPPLHAPLSVAQSDHHVAGAFFSDVVRWLVEAGRAHGEGEGVRGADGLLRGVRYGRVGCRARGHWPSRGRGWRRLQRSEELCGALAAARGGVDDGRCGSAAHGVHGLVWRTLLPARVHMRVHTRVHMRVHTRTPTRPQRQRKQPHSYLNPKTPGRNRSSWFWRARGAR